MSSLAQQRTAQAWSVPLLALLTGGMAVEMLCRLRQAEQQLPEQLPEKLQMVGSCRSQLEQLLMLWRQTRRVCHRLLLGLTAGTQRGQLQRQARRCAPGLGDSQRRLHWQLLPWRQRQTMAAEEELQEQRCCESLH